MEDGLFPSRGLWSFKSKDLISDSYPHSHKAISVWGKGPKYIFLNLKNNENDAAVFVEMCKKKQRLK